MTVFLPTTAQHQHYHHHRLPTNSFPIQPTDIRLIPPKCVRLHGPDNPRVPPAQREFIRHPLEMISPLHAAHRPAVEKDRSGHSLPPLSLLEGTVLHSHSHSHNQSSLPPLFVILGAPPTTMKVKMTHSTPPSSASISPISVHRRSARPPPRTSHRFLSLQIKPALVRHLPTEESCIDRLRQCNSSRRIPPT